MDLIDIYTALHPKAEEYTFFSSAHRIFSKIDYILGHEVSLGKFKEIEIIPSIFSNHNTMRLEINYKKKKQTTKTIEYRNNRIHFLLKCSWNILQDRSYLGSQIKPWEI